MTFNAAGKNIYEDHLDGIMIKLTNDQYTTIDKGDKYLIDNFTWFACSKKGKYYAYTTIDKKDIRLD